MIVLFTDFGLHGPYTGQMKAVLHQTAPGVPVIDLFADAPVGNPKAAAYLLPAYAGWFPAGTVFPGTVNLIGSVRDKAHEGRLHERLFPSGHARDLRPGLEGLGSGGPVLGGGAVVTAEVEEVVDLVVGGEKTLGLAS